MWASLVLKYDEFLLKTILIHMIWVFSFNGQMQTTDNRNDWHYAITLKKKHALSSCACCRSSCILLVSSLFSKNVSSPLITSNARPLVDQVRISRSTEWLSELGHINQIRIICHKKKCSLLAYAAAISRHISLIVDLQGNAINWL